MSSFAQPKHASSDVGDEFTLLQFTTALLRARRPLVAIPFAFAFVTGVTVLSLPKQYTTTVSFSTSSASALPAQLAGLAAQFNVTLPGQDNSQGPEFYADLVTRPEALIELVEAPFYVARLDGDSAHVAFIELMEIDEGDRGRTVAAAVRTLKSDVLAVDPNRNTGVLRVTVRTRWPELSLQMASRILEQVEAYNLASRRTQAKAESAFVASRLEVARLELRSVEDLTEQFLQRNREFRSDPRLLFEYERLQREIALRQGIFVTLSQGLEQSRIEAVRNTPSISVVEQPLLALRYDRRNTLTKVLAAAFLGVVLVVASAIARTVSLERRTARESEIASFRREVENARSELKGILGGLGSKHRDGGDTR